MTDLLSRISAAAGPSRELDAEIALAHGWKQERDTFIGDCWKSPQGRYQPGPPRYTESIDAALTLVPKGLFWLIGYGKTRPDEPLYGAQILSPSEDWTEPDSVISEGESNATPAIALVIACLKAKEDSKP